jgi:DUF4097 and DUF4098 domain-containing protein YvlB
MAKSFETPGPIMAEVDIAAGSVHLISGDRTETLVTVNPADPNSELDVAAAEKARVEFADSRLSVVVPKPGGLLAYISFRSWGLVDVTIELPEGSSVDAKTGAGDVRADGSFGEVTVRSGAGDIDVDQAHARRLISGAGRLRLGSSSGHTELITAGDMDIGQIDGPAEIKNLNGETRIGEVTGSIRVKSANGHIVVDRAHTDVAVRTANGNVAIGEVIEGTVTLATASGGIDIGIAEGTSAWVDAGTTYGRVHNDLDAAGGPETPGERVEIRARTSFGDVHIHRSSPSENR